MKTLNIGILGAPPVSENKGCEALLYSNLWLLDEIAAEAGIMIKPFIISGSSVQRELIFHIGTKKVKATLIPELSLFSKSTTVHTLLNLRRIKRYLDLDFLLSIGFGDSFSDIYGVERFESVNAPIRFMQRLGKKVIVLPQTIGPFAEERIRRKARKTLSGSICILARDLRSRECVNELLPQRECPELIDAAFFMPYESVRFSDGKIHVGVGISGLLWRNGYTGKNEFRLQEDYKTLMQNILELFMNDNNVILHLIPHVVNGQEFHDDDYTLALDIQQKYGSDKIVVAPFFKNPISAKNYISGMDFFLGSRMHACIAAFSSGVPVFPLAYSRKFNGLFLDTLSYPHMGDLTAGTSSEIIGALSRAFVARDQIRSEIASKNAVEVAEYREKYKQILKQQFGLL